MKPFDLHCDTYTLVVHHPMCDIRKNPFQIDLTRLHEIDATGQVFALFHDCNGRYDDDSSAVIFDYIKTFYKDIQKHSDITKLITNYTQFKETLHSKKQSILLGIEDGGLVSNNLDEAFRYGVRLITLTWNHINAIGYPSTHPNEGLTDFGFEFIERMNQLGMIIDVSHLSDQGTIDVMEHSTKPIVASHSNARAVKNHARNLPDSLIKGIAKKGGTIGLNFYTPFVSHHEETYTNELIKHLNHLINIGGEDVVAIGSDYDGIPNVTDFGDISGLPIFAYNLKKAGFSESLIDKLFYKNAVRTITDILK